MATMKVKVESHVDYTPEQLRVFLLRIIEAGKEYALYDEGAESDLADMMTEIEISNPEAQE